MDDALDECDEDGHLVDGEREVTFRMRCPRWVPSLWRDAVELARRVAGEPLPVWRAAEAIAQRGSDRRRRIRGGTRVGFSTPYRYSRAPMPSP